ncbi:MAG: fibronectin type III domain-containing protein [Clostridia bacterium]|nr:fibronectin type III domain-containing protein [Clostridia bacterium]
MYNKRYKTLRRTFCLALASFLIILDIFSSIMIVNAYQQPVFNFTAAPVPQSPDTKIRLQWDSVISAYFYKLLRDDTEIANLSVGTDKDYLSYVDTGLKPETSYTYRINVYSDANMQDLIRTSTITVSTLKMLRPTNLSARYNINTDEITLSWTNNSSALTLNEIKRVNTSSVLSTVSGTASTATFSVSEIVEGQPVQTIRLSATSKDNLSHSSFDSDSIEITLIHPPVINAVLQNGVATISWGNYSYITNFNLERSKYVTNAWSEWEIINTQIASGATSVLDTPPGEGIYRYRLNAKSLSLYAGTSNISKPLSKPTAPTNLSSLFVDMGRIDLSWTLNPNNNYEIRVERKINNGSFVYLAGLEKTAAAYSDYISIVPNTTYTYRVLAIDSNDNYSISNQSEFTAAIPLAPQTLGLAVASNTQINLAWEDKSVNEKGFKIERKIDSGGFIEIAAVGSNITSYSDTSVTSGHNYTYRVGAFNPMGNSAGYTNEVTTNTAALAAPPIALTLTPVTANRIDLVWAYAGNLNTNTIIERKTGAAGVWQTIASINTTATKYSDTGLSPNTQYFYRVKAVPKANIYSLYYPNDNTGKSVYTKLNKPTNLIGNASSIKQINLTWTDNSDEKSFVIERRTDNKGYVFLSSTGPDETTFADTSVAANTRYTYRIKAANETNSSEYSDELSITCSVLDTPTSLSANAVSNNEAEIRWLDNTLNESGFEVWRKTGAANWEKIASTYANATGYTDASLKPNTQYSYKVRAFILRDEIYSQFSNDATTQTTVLTAPTGLNFTVPSDEQVKLIWKDNSADESGFKVEKKLGDEGDWVEIASLPQNTTTYLSTDLAPFTKYYYRVKVYSSVFNSSNYSETITVLTGAPRAPSDLVLVDFSSTRIDLSWRSNSNNIQGFKIERRGEGESFVEIAQVDGETTTYSDRTVQSKTRYYYRVRAFNRSGDSEYCEEKFTTTNAFKAFQDIADTYWARNYIVNLANRGIIKGKSEGLFAPGDKVTRAEFVALLVRTFKINRTPVGTFLDVKPGDWFYKEVMIAKVSGIVSGNNNNYFYPNQSITREDMAVMAARTLKIIDKPLPAYENNILNRFSDVGVVSAYALPSLAAMNGERIINGRSETHLAPKDFAIRAEAAVILNKIIDR